MFIIAATLISKMSPLSAQLRYATDYEILRDTVLIVVGIIAAAAAIIGVSLYFVLRRTLEQGIVRKATSAIELECRRFHARNDIQAGVIHWISREYDRAIKKTLGALKEAEDLLEEREIIWAKSNLGYYYAEKHKQRAARHLKKDSIALTKIGYDKYSPTVPDFNHPDWIDNYIFACATFVENPKEKKKVLSLVDTFLTREDLSFIQASLKESRKDLLKLRFPN